MTLHQTSGGIPDPAGDVVREARKARKRPPQIITSDYDGAWILASNQEDALACALDNYGPGTTLEPQGWMVNVGWDREHYDLKRDFQERTGYTEWWEASLVASGIEETAKIRRAWAVVDS